MAEIKEAVAHETSIAVRDRILYIGSWQIGPNSLTENWDFETITTFAWGGKANNKLVVDLVLEPYAEYAKVVPDDRRVSEKEFLDARELVLDAHDQMLDLIDEPDTVWGVPTGGQSFAFLRARRRHLAAVLLEKDDIRPGQKTYKPHDMIDVANLMNARVMVGSEDAGSLAASPYGAMYGSDHNGLSLLREKTVALQYIWVRGPLTRIIEADPSLPIHTLVHEPIPEQIRREDEFFRRFGHLAVRVQAKL
ncbi:MAG TPA: hypothetical protein VLG47_06225 [Candidatus Saccharimonadales bacterium]|nr:hypothetical protein [Candidatus Saccharimonadales bacterium]